MTTTHGPIPTDTAPVLSDITKRNGIAGQYFYNVTVTYPGEAPMRIGFVHSIYGGPVVVVDQSGAQTFVHADVMSRCGDALTEQWIADYFGTKVPA